MNLHKYMPVLVLALSMMAVVSCGRCENAPPPPPAEDGMMYGKGGNVFRKHPPAPLLFGNVRKLQRRLGLSDQQIETISAINERYRIVHQQLWQNALPLRRELHDELLSETVNRDRIRGLLRQLSENDIERQLAIIDQRMEIEKELTVEQRKKIMRIHRPRP